MVYDLDQQLLNVYRHSNVNGITNLKCGYNRIRRMGERGGSRGKGGGIRKLHNVSKKSIKE